MICSNEVDYLRSTLEFVKSRMSDKSMEAVKSPVAFMRKALKDNYLATAKVRQTPSVVKKVVLKPTQESTVDAVRISALERAIQNFDRLTKEKQSTIVSLFQQASATHKRLKVGGVMFRKTLAGWLVDQYPKLKTDSLFVLE